MDFKAPKHNTPIATLIRNYQNKKSGKVVESRREIQRRFKCLDWVHQKKILLAFINASVTDRDWASRKMYVFWDKSFIPIVKTLWELYHEEPLSWLIIRYFPKNYLKLNMDALVKRRNYYYLCQRFIDDEDFVIDKERLYESDLINLYTISKKQVADEVISEAFFSLIRKICIKDYNSTYMYEWDIELEDINNMSILTNRKVICTLYVIEYDLNKSSLANYLRMWSRKVMDDAKNSNEFRMIKQMALQGYNYRPNIINLIKKYCLKHLDQNETILEEPVCELIPSRIMAPERNRSTPRITLNEMCSRNPVIGKLINELGMEIYEY